VGAARDPEVNPPGPRFRPARRSRSLSLAAALAALLAGGAVRAESVTSVRRPLLVSSPVAGRVASFGGDVTIRARVSGDVVVWGGDATIEAGGSVDGDVVDFGGRVVAPPGTIRGRVLTPGSLAALYLAEARSAPWSRDNPASGRGDVSWRTFAGLRLFLLAVWMLASALVLRFRGSAVARASVALEENPALAAASGVIGIVFLFLAGVAAFAAFPAAMRVPAAAVILAAAFGSKLFGMTALFLFLGQKLGGKLAPAARPAALALGLGVCGAVSLVPVAGPILWSAASILAVGAAIFTRLGSPRFRVSAA
jgi:hypothetical protein